MAKNNSSWAKSDGNRVKVTSICGKPKRITGTRLGAILGMNQWKTPFQAWCEITRVAEPPFEGNKYTEAGKAIEPKLVEYCKEIVSPDIVTPEDWFGEDFFNKTRGNFFSDTEVFGGMWDALYKVNGKVAGVIECKTSSRPQDWVDGVPEHYAVQGMLYAYLLGVEDVYFPVAFLQGSDYDDPESFECTDDNTVVYHVKVEGEFYSLVHEAIDWWYKHVYDGAVSPEYDEKKDSEYLELMGRTEVADVNTASEIAARIEELQSEVGKIRAEFMMDSKEKEIKDLTAKLKGLMIDTFTAECRDKQIEAVTFGRWTLKKTVQSDVDKESMEKDGVLEKYAKESVSYRLTRGRK